MAHTTSHRVCAFFEQHNVMGMFTCHTLPQPDEHIVVSTCNPPCWLAKEFETMVPFFLFFDLQWLQHHLCRLHVVVADATP